MVWPVWVSIAALIGCLSLLRGDSARSEMGFVILAGLLSMQMVKEVMHHDYWWVSSFLIWVTAGGVVAMTRTEFTGSNVAVSLLLVVAGVCYAAGKALGHEYGAASPAMKVSDIAGVASLLFVGGPVFVGFIRDFMGGEWGRGSGLGSHLLRGVFGGEASGGSL